MAIYHLSAKVVQRSKGRSATAAAAYRAGDLIACEREGRAHDYTRKRGVAHVEMVGWSGDRAALWNAAEAVERRKDATTAREYEIALPIELGRDEQIALARQFATWLHERHGVAVDFALHDLETGNPHAHVLTTTRPVEADGETLAGIKAEVEWSDKKRKAHGLSPRKEELEAARVEWERRANAALADAGSSARIDHRSLADQGADRPPEQHEGPTVRRIEKRAQRRAARDDAPYEPATNRGQTNADAREIVAVERKIAALREDAIAAAAEQARREAEEQARRESEAAVAADEARQQAQAREIIDTLDLETADGIAALREKARRLRDQPEPPPVDESVVRQDAEAFALERVEFPINRDGRRVMTTMWDERRRVDELQGAATSASGEYEGQRIAAQWQREQERERLRQRNVFVRLFKRLFGKASESPELAQLRDDAESAQAKADQAKEFVERLDADVPTRQCAADAMRSAGNQAVRDAHERHADALTAHCDAPAIADLIDAAARDAERRIEADDDAQPGPDHKSADENLADPDANPLDEPPQPNPRPKRPTMDM